MNLKKYAAMGLGAIMAMGITLSSFSAVSADNNVAPRSAVMTTASHHNNHHNYYGNHYDDYEGVITSNVNVRAKASTKSTKVGYLKKGAVVEIERKASNGWYKIEYRHMEGYISPKYVTVYNDEYREIDKKGTTTAKVTVRAGASTKATKRGTLAKGTRVEVESKTSNGWYKIEYRGGEGYVQAKYIKLVADRD